MRIFKAIVISSLSIPILAFIIFSGAGFVFMVVMLIQGGGYNKGWLGMVYAGAVYSYFALLVSSIPTIALGWPASLVADKYGYLRKQIVLPGAALLGGLFLAVFGTLFFKIANVQIFLWLFLAGLVGGLINGVVFFRYLEPNKSLVPTPETARHVS